MSSTRVLLELTIRLLVAWPAMSPPMRKNVSWTGSGLLAWLAVEPAGLMVSRALELVVPASNSRPSIRTPSTSATCMADTVPPPPGGSSQSICQVTLMWETAYGKAFQIQVSPDATTWTPISSPTTGTGGAQTLPVTGTGRYIRMHGTVRRPQCRYSLWGFQVYSR